MAYSPFDASSSASLLQDPAFRSTFATTPGWQPRPLEERQRHEQALAILQQAPAPYTPGETPQQTLARLNQSTPERIASVPGLGGPPAIFYGSGGQGGMPPAVAELFAQHDTFAPAAARLPITRPSAGGTISYGGMHFAAPAGGGAMVGDSRLDLVQDFLAGSRTAAGLPQDLPYDQPSRGEIDPARRSQAFSTEAVRRYLRSGGDAKGLGTVLERALALVPPPQHQLGETMDVGGRTYVRTNKDQITPLREDKTGYGTANEAAAAIPKGSKGSVKQNSDGRWVADYQVGDEDEKPFTVREFQSQPDLMKEYKMSYRNYLSEFNRLKAEKDGVGGGGGPPRAKAPTPKNDIPTFRSAAPTPQGAQPPPTAIAMLKANPGSRAQFDAKYGQGAAARALGEAQR